MLRLDQLAWVAALVEGEGCPHMSRRGNRGNEVRLSVGMTDRDVIERLAKYWSVGVHASPKPAPRQTIYSAILTGNRAIGWMLTLYSWLGQRRRARIREIVAEWKSSPGHAKHRKSCPAGHDYAGRNLLITARKTGGVARRCRTCNRLKMRAARQALKEAV